MEKTEKREKNREEDSEDIEDREEGEKRPILLLTMPFPFQWPPAGSTSNIISFEDEHINVSCNIDDGNTLIIKLSEQLFAEYVIIWLPDPAIIGLNSPGKFEEIIPDPFHKPFQGVLGTKFRSNIWLPLFRHNVRVSFWISVSITRYSAVSVHPSKV